MHLFRIAAASQSQSASQVRHRGAMFRIRLHCYIASSLRRPCGVCERICSIWGGHVFGVLLLLATCNTCEFLRQCRFAHRTGRRAGVGGGFVAPGCRFGECARARQAHSRYIITSTCTAALKERRVCNCETFQSARVHVCYTAMYVKIYSHAFVSRLLFEQATFRLTTWRRRRPACVVAQHVLPFSDSHLTRTICASQSATAQQTKKSISS